MDRLQTKGARLMNDKQFIQFQDDFYDLLEKYGVKDIDIEHPKFTKILNLRDKVVNFIEEQD